MSVIGLSVAGTNRIALRFEQFPNAARAEIKATVESLTDRLEAAIRSGAPVRSGSLQASIKSTIYDDPNRVRGVVTVTKDFAKVAALEYGAHGPAKVKAGTRSITTVFGRRLAAPIRASIRAYSRSANVAARSFLRGPLAGMSTTALAELRAAVERATDTANAP